MKYFLPLCCTFLLFDLCAQPSVHYNIRYSPKMAKEGLLVEVSVKLDKPADSVYFHFSNDVWGESDLHDCLTDLKGSDKSYRFRKVSDSNRLVVIRPHMQEVRFSYHIRQDKADHPDITNRPKVQQTYFHILGESLFTVPESFFVGIGKDPQVHVTIDWIGFPENFTIHNMFGSQERHQEFTVSLWEALYHSLLVGGDYRLQTFHFQSNPVILAVRGDWYTYTDSLFLQKLRETISVQRTFWNDNRFPYYTVIISPQITFKDSSYRGQSMTGSGIYNGFMIQSTNNVFNSWSSMNYIFYHEMMHDWIGGKLRVRYEELNYWFSEGFTDYYTFKGRLRSGSLGREEWLSEFNREVWKAHYLNPERNQPNYMIKDAFWENRNIEKIPYRRGALFAFWLDQQLLIQSNGQFSLDDLMRVLLSECEANHTEVTDDLFLSYAERHLDRKIAYFFQKHVIAGVDINWDEFPLQQGIQVTKDTNGIPQLTITGNTTDVFRFYLQE